MNDVARPNKLFDESTLEQWAISHHPDILNEWEDSEFMEWIDFWDWLGDEYPELLCAFEKDFHRREEE
jgi:hypothetical protein